MYHLLLEILLIVAARKEGEILSPKSFIHTMIFLMVVLDVTNKN